MQAITTKYLPPTNTLPRRVKAECQAGSVTISDEGMSTHDRDLHNAAARKLCEKLDWHGYLVEGTTKQGDNVYVFIPHIGSDIRWDEVLKVGHPVKVKSKRTAKDRDRTTPCGFVRYLRETLIPDLKESGRDCTAEDFETACDIIEREVTGVMTYATK